ncbi:protein-S-isoprenylcysteine O-methyltransferase [Palaemon carinicauda]|uniref:protein-S-isoprenylcysteine O-methyltransferase n=1 Tax=Palaemon carinicauda TaxID=392227 RepID=UPI0035B58AC3
MLSAIAFVPECDVVKAFETVKYFLLKHMLQDILRIRSWDDHVEGGDDENQCFDEQKSRKKYLDVLKRIITVVAVRGCFLGSACGIGIIISFLTPASYQIFGWYLVVLTFFHYSEYFTTAIGNPRTLSLDSYLLNHSISYGLAAITSWIEFFIERWLLPEMKTQWILSVLGIIVCLWGEIVRKSAMLTAKTNFNHIVQTKREEGHELVTWGAYALFRHPSYVGWFWWSIGTQLILINPVCTLAYTIAAWSFFYERIYFEEMTLINFFGEKYLDYQKKVGTGLPFIKGYQSSTPVCIRGQH